MVFSIFKRLFFLFILNCHPASEEVLSILNHQKILIGLDSCSRSFLILWVPTIQSLDACLIKFEKLQYVNLCFLIISGSLMRLGKPKLRSMANVSLF